MKTLVTILLALLLFFVASVENSAVARLPEREGYWGDYARAPAPERFYGMSFVTQPNVLEDGADNPVLVRWGELFQVKCRGGTSNDLALLCLTMSRTSTPSWGSSEYAGDEGFGFFDDTAGPSGIEGPLPCFTVDNGAVEWRKASIGAFVRSGTAVAPTFRAGRCTAGDIVDIGAGGAPCDTDNECGASGECTKDGQYSAGAWVIGISTDSTMVCSFEFGI